MIFINKSKIPNLLTIFRIFLAVVIFVLLVAHMFVCDNFFHIWQTTSGDQFHNNMENYWHFVIYRIKLPNSLGYQPTQISRLLFSAGILFVIACCTDAIDGFLARKYHWVSDFGKLWDPLADKILVNGILIIFACMYSVFWPLVVIMILRDIIVDGTKMYASTKGHVVAADVFGKLKTIFQMIGLLILFFIFNANSYPRDFNEPWTPNYLKNYLEVDEYHSYLHPCYTYWEWWVTQNTVIIIATIFSIISGVNYMIKINRLVKKSKIQK